jgi:hypothetical protein
MFASRSPCATLRRVGETPYRAVEEGGGFAEAPLREVEDRYNAFASGDRCRACGASGAHPATVCEGDGYDARSKTLEEYPGRVALCESCAAAQDHAMRRLSAWSGVIVAPACTSLVAQWVIVEFVEPTGILTSEVLAVLAVLFATMIASTLWLRRRARKTLLPAVLTAGRGQKITVQLATPAALARPPRTFVGVAPWRRGWTAGILFAVALVTVPLNLIVSVTLNPKIMVSNGAATNVVLNGRYVLASAPRDAVQWYFYTRGATVRLDFMGSFEAEPLVLDGGDAHLDLSTPSCASSVRDGERASVVYKWFRHGREFRLRCPDVE